jgi:hypothetical protein
VRVRTAGRRLGRSSSRERRRAGEHSPIRSKWLEGGWIAYLKIYKLH